MTHFWTIQHVAATASTNADLAQLAHDGAREGTALVADHQEAGRGRLGRSWHTPAGMALTVSFLLRPASIPVTQWSWLPLLAGVAVVDAVADVAGCQAELKWPNDVLVRTGEHGELKLAGILVERVETSHGAAAVVGIGINVLQHYDDLPATATSLALSGSVEPTREAALEAVAGRLAEAYTEWNAVGGDPHVDLAAAYLKRCGTIGRDVTATLPAGGSIVGKAVDVDELGRLVVDGETGRTAIAAGDILHLRPLATGA